MFKHILVPVDGSETAQKAVEKAAGLAKAFGSAATVIYVIDPYPFTGLGSDFAYGQAEYLSAATAEAEHASADPSPPDRWHPDVNEPAERPVFLRP